MGPDLELVRIFPNDQLGVDKSGDLVFEPGALVEAVSLLMAHRPGGWKVAGLGGWLPRPGWPPQYEMITQLED